MFKESLESPQLISGYAEEVSRAPNVVFYEGRPFVIPRWVFGIGAGAAVLMMAYIGFQTVHTESSQVVGQVSSLTAQVGQIQPQFEASNRSILDLKAEFKVALAARDATITAMRDQINKLDKDLEALKKREPVVCTTPKQNGGVRFVPC